MTFHEVYQNGKITLKKAGVESPAFDAVCIFQAVFGLNRQALILHGNEEAPNELIQSFQDKILQRAEKRPLQYILGTWEFLSLQLSVGEGVLIPREETELLVYTAKELLKKEICEQEYRVLDLCAGTGAVSLGIASVLPKTKVICVELYEQALGYLKTNIEAYPQYEVTAMQADVLHANSTNLFADKFDAIVSNPPYIISEEVRSLQTEVQKEPHTALDGGKDGLIFYRAIADYWVPLLKDGGILAVEIGEEQAEEVTAILHQAGITNLVVKQDFNGLDRVAAGIYQRTK